MKCIPLECCSTSLILYCLLEQVVASKEGWSLPNSPESPGASDGLHPEIAKTLAFMMHTLAIESTEKELLADFAHPEAIQSNTPIAPKLLSYGDEISHRTHHLEPTRDLDVSQVELQMLNLLLRSKIMRTTTGSTDKLQRAHAQHLLQHCSVDNRSDMVVHHAIMQFVFESLELPHIGTSEHGRAILWDRPLAFVEKPVSTSITRKLLDGTEEPNVALQGEANESSEGMETIQTLIKSTQLRCLDDWTHCEHYRPSVLIQVLLNAKESYHSMQRYSLASEDAVLFCFYNPLTQPLQLQETWHCSLHTNIYFRDYLEHVADSISEWIQWEFINGPMDITNDGRIKLNDKKYPGMTPEIDNLKNTSICEKRAQADNFEHLACNTSIRTKSLKGQVKETEQEKEAENKKGWKSESKRAPSSTKKKEPLADCLVKDQDVALTTKVNMDPPAKANITPLKHVFLGYEMDHKLVHLSGTDTTLFPVDGGEIHVKTTHFAKEDTAVQTCIRVDGHCFTIHTRIIGSTEELPDIAEPLVEEMQPSVRPELFSMILADGIVLSFSQSRGHCETEGSTFSINPLSTQNSSPSHTSLKQHLTPCQRSRNKSWWRRLVLPRCCLTVKIESALRSPEVAPCCVPGLRAPSRCSQPTVLETLRFMRTARPRTCTPEDRPRRLADILVIFHGIYTLCPKAHVTCEAIDSDGNIFRVQSDGKTAVIKAGGDGLQDEEFEDRESLTSLKTKRPESYGEHAPRFFLIHPDWSGTELLRMQDVEQFLSESTCDPSTVLLQESLPDNAAVQSVTVLTPEERNWSTSWLSPPFSEGFTSVGLRTQSERCILSQKATKLGLGLSSGRGHRLASGIFAFDASRPALPPSCPPVLHIRQLLSFPRISPQQRHDLQLRLKGYLEELRQKEKWTQEVRPLDLQNGGKQISTTGGHRVYLYTSNSKSQDQDLEETEISQRYLLAIQKVPPTPAVQVNIADAVEEISETERKKEQEARECLHDLVRKAIPPYFSSQREKVVYVNQIPELEALTQALPPLNKKEACILTTTPQNHDNREASPHESIMHHSLSADHIKDLKPQEVPQTTKPNILLTKAGPWDSSALRESSTQTKCKSLFFDLLGNSRKNRVPLPLSMEVPHPRHIPNPRVLNYSLDTNPFLFVPAHVAFGEVRRGERCSRNVMLHNLSLQKHRYVGLAVKHEILIMIGLSSSS
uniref:Sperm associated antigen 17 n=1 Tax=Eptatretus burgeri TaxID=7764 RepID=A0A8C4NMM3_EPTBU